MFIYRFIASTVLLAFAAASEAPSNAPTSGPTSAPSLAPTSDPTSSPSAAPSSEPTSNPTETPSAAPTSSPSAAPSFSPTTNEPSSTPTSGPTGSARCYDLRVRLEVADEVDDPSTMIDTLEVSLLRNDVVVYTDASNATDHTSSTLEFSLSGLCADDTGLDNLMLLLYPVFIGNVRFHLNDTQRFEYYVHSEVPTHITMSVDASAAEVAFASVTYDHGDSALSSAICAHTYPYYGCYDESHDMVVLCLNPGSGVNVSFSMNDDTGRTEGSSELTDPFSTVWCLHDSKRISLIVSGELQPGGPIDVGYAPGFYLYVNGDLISSGNATNNVTFQLTTNEGPSDPGCQSDESTCSFTNVTTGEIFFWCTSGDCDGGGGSGQGCQSDESTCSLTNVTTGEEFFWCTSGDCDGGGGSGQECQPEESTCPCSFPDPDSGEEIFVCEGPFWCTTGDCFGNNDSGNNDCDGTFNCSPDQGCQCETHTFANATDCFDGLSLTLLPMSTQHAMHWTFSDDAGVVLAEGSGYDASSNDLTVYFSERVCESQDYYSVRLVGVDSLYMDVYDGEDVLFSKAFPDSQTQIYNLLELRLKDNQLKTSWRENIELKITDNPGFLGSWLIAPGICLAIVVFYLAKFRCRRRSDSSDSSPETEPRWKSLVRRMQAKLRRCCRRDSPSSHSEPETAAAAPEPRWKAMVQRVRPLYSFAMKWYGRGTKVSDYATDLLMIGSLVYMGLSPPDVQVSLESVDPAMGVVNITFGYFPGSTNIELAPSCWSTVEHDFTDLCAEAGYGGVVSFAVSSDEFYAGAQLGRDAEQRGWACKQYTECRHCPGYSGDSSSAATECRNDALFPEFFRCESTGLQRSIDAGRATTLEAATARNNKFWSECTADNIDEMVGDFEFELDVKCREYNAIAPSIIFINDVPWNCVDKKLGSSSSCSPGDFKIIGLLFALLVLVVSKEVMAFASWRLLFFGLSLEEIEEFMGDSATMLACCLFRLPGLKKDWFAQCNKRISDYPTFCKVWIVLDILEKFVSASLAAILATYRPTFFVIFSLVMSVQGAQTAMAFWVDVYTRRADEADGADDKAANAAGDEEAQADTEGDHRATPRARPPARLGLCSLDFVSVVSLLRAAHVLVIISLMLQLAFSYPGFWQDNPVVGNVKLILACVLLALSVFGELAHANSQLGACQGVDRARKYRSLWGRKLLSRTDPQLVAELDKELGISGRVKMFLLEECDLSNVVTYGFQLAACLNVLHLFGLVYTFAVEIACWDDGTGNEDLCRCDYRDMVYPMFTPERKLAMDAVVYLFILNAAFHLVVEAVRFVNILAGKTSRSKLLDKINRIIHQHDKNHDGIELSPLDSRTRVLSSGSGASLPLPSSLKWEAPVAPSTGKTAVRKPENA